MDKELEAWVKEWRRREAERFLNARCQVCDRRSDGRLLLHLTNDWKQFLCDEHRHLDTSKRVVDVAFQIQASDYGARIDGYRPFTREECLATYREWLADSRVTLINIPEWLLALDRKETAQPDQLILFDESEAQS
jgi:hypothetical protein